MLITGRVTDTSPGTMENEQAKRFPQGVPAVSDESQELWMPYVYGQQFKPTNSTGVKVHLTAIDPNNNFQDIGVITTDLNGNYATSWKPPVTGVYKIIATFEGTKSYYASQAETACIVEAATLSPIAIPTQPPAETPKITTTSPIQTPLHSASPSATQAPQPPASNTATETYIVLTGAVLVIIVVAAAVILRKRK